MITQFQKRLVKDTDTLLEIVKIFHPDLPEKGISKKGVEYLVKSKIKAFYKYDWVCIKLKVKGFDVSIVVENCSQYTLFGPTVTKAMMAKALEDGTCKFRAWRFVDNFGYILRKYTLGEVDPDLPYNNKVIELLKSKGYTLQSVDEMFEIYYKD